MHSTLPPTIPETSDDDHDADGTVRVATNVNHSSSKRSISDSNKLTSRSRIEADTNVDYTDTSTNINNNNSNNSGNTTPSNKSGSQNSSFPRGHAHMTFHKHHHQHHHHHQGHHTDMSPVSLSSSTSSGAPSSASSAQESVLLSEHRKSASAELPLEGPSSAALTLGSPSSAPSRATPLTIAATTPIANGNAVTMNGSAGSPIHCASSSSPLSHSHSNTFDDGNKVRACSQSELNLDDAEMSKLSMNRGSVLDSALISSLASNSNKSETQVHRNPDGKADDSKRPTPIATSRWSISSWSMNGKRHEPSTSVEAEKVKHRLMEQGILRFNANPKKGIGYLVKQGLIENTHESVASFLCSTAGLRKEQIGDYLGDEDDFNKSVMFHYVNRMNFRSMSFDEALRYFLSGFRLPGEAQKIDRLMEKFAERFCRDNPDAFSDQDAAYILAFSLIILNTDAHSPNVKNKMTKAGFLRNCRDLLKQGITREFLSECYDNIVNNEIQIKQDYLEQLYTRVVVNDISAVRLAKRRRLSSVEMLKQQIRPELEQVASMLQSPSPISPSRPLLPKMLDHDSNLYQAAAANVQASLNTSTSTTTVGNAFAASHVANVSTLGVAVGEVGDDLGDASFFDLRRVAHISKLTSGHVFTKYGRAGKPHLRRVWLSEDQKYIYYQDQKKQTKPKKLNTDDIMDVTIGRNTTSVLERGNVPAYKDHLCFSIITSSRTLDLESDNEKDVHLWTNYLTQIAEHNRLTAQAAQMGQYRLQKENRLSSAVDVWKSYVLPNWPSSELKIRRKIRDLWLQGIPPCIRCFVWPLAIGNQLEITPQLFTRFHNLARSNHADLIQGKPAFVNLEKSLLTLEHDLPLTFPELRFFHVQGPNLPSSELRDVLESYLFYRPDIGYVSGMSHLAATLLLYLDLYGAFVQLCNLLNTPLLLSFCRMDGDGHEQCEWRLAYLTQLIATHLPAVSIHFKYLSLASHEFAVDWFRSLFTRFLPLDIASRVWDLYLLDGEITAFRTALGIVKYFQRQLVRSTYDECLFLLTNPAPRDEINEVSFWACVSSCSADDVIPINQFRDLLRKHAAHTATTDAVSSNGDSLIGGGIPKLDPLILKESAELHLI